MKIFIDEKEELKKLRQMHKHRRWSCKNAFETLQEELEDEYLENLCANNEEVLYDVTTFIRDYEELDDDTVKRMVLEYNPFWKRYNIRFY